LKILVTGVRGQLGYDVIKELKKRDIDCMGVGREEFDILDFNATQSYIKAYLPDAVIHCAAYTAVDKAEEEIELCRAINVEGTRNIALVCKEIDAKMLYISTDYVFDGQDENVHEVDDKINPLGVYGKTKLEGENVVKEIVDKYFIVRISWVFGKNGNNFVKTMLRLAKERDVINVVADQIGSPTYTVDLALLLCDMVLTQKYGTYHATNEGVCSWAEFAEEIFKQSGLKTKVNSITTEMYPTKAQRPKNSKISKVSLDKNEFNRLPDWKDALMRFLKDNG
jgi:dTDP-4-dehydrorhamnose reductase